MKPASYNDHEILTVRNVATLIKYTFHQPYLAVWCSPSATLEQGTHLLKHLFLRMSKEKAKNPTPTKQVEKLH
jgi:hypothetical protein